MMWDAAARKITKRGGKVLMGRELQQLAYDADQQLWRIEVSTADGGREELHRAPRRSARRRCAN